jgi:HK97 family phage portal protein
MWNPFRRREVETRAVESVPWDVGGPLQVAVNESSALGLSAVYAAVRHLTDLISTLPLQAYRQEGDTRRRLSALPQLLRDLDGSGELSPWLCELVGSMALHGNAVGAVTRRDGMEFAADVVWLPMTEVTVDDSNLLHPQWYWKGRKVSRDELVHIKWIKMPGRTLALSPIEAYALTVASGLQAQAYGSDWFASGGFPPGTFKNSAKTVAQEDADIIKGRLTAAIRARKPLVYGSDWDYSPVTVPPEQAQFIETMKMTANQVAAIYGIAPDEIGGEAANSLTYSTEELRQIRRIADVRPWLVHIEDGLSALLPDRQYLKFNANAVIRADIQTRYNVYEVAQRIGMLSLNEERALEDYPPVPGGDGHKPLGSTPPPMSTPSPLMQPVSSNGNGASKPTLTQGA